MTTTIEPWLRDILRCPACTGVLKDVTGPQDTQELHCSLCRLSYRIDSGIPVLLIDEARSTDRSTE